MSGRRRDRIKRILAVLLVVALIGTMIISVIVTSARGEEAEKDRYTLELTWFEEEQALRVTQRLIYRNRTGRTLDRVMFSLYADLFRREGLVAEVYPVQDICPNGYAPGGAAILGVTVNGEPAEWGVHGEGEYFLRVACALDPDGQCEFGFEYDLLLTGNSAFCGLDGDTCRLSGFYPLAACCGEEGWEANDPVATGRFALAEPADYSVSILLPERYTFSSPGIVAREKLGDGMIRWRAEAGGLREYACCFGKAWRQKTGKTKEGTAITVRTGLRSIDRLLKTAVRAADFYESRFGALPRSVEIVETTIVAGSLSFAGEIWLDGELLRGSEGEQLIRSALAEQYFGNLVFPDPVADAWMNTALCEYLALTALGEEAGEEAMEERLRDQYAPALSVTVPGCYGIDASAALFTPDLFRIVVRDRGCVAIHEMKVSLGRETFLEGLKGYLRSAGSRFARKKDLTDALSAAAGWDTEPFLSELLAGIDEYAEMYMHGYE